MSKEDLSKPEDYQLHEACCYLQGRLETAMTGWRNTVARDCLVVAIEAIETLQEMRKNQQSR